MIKVIPFPPIPTSFQRIFILITSSIAEADAIVANGTKIFLVK